MVPKTPIKCVECQKTESTLLWRTDQHGQFICQECYEHKSEMEEAEENKEKEKTLPSTTDDKRLRRTRATRCKSKNNAATNQSDAGAGSKASTKGRSRRNLFKKTPCRTPVVQATTHIVESVFHKGSYIQVGDIVSLVSQNSVYYAQIRGLMVDNYCEKSAYLTWLIPTQASPDPNFGFDPATYIIGPDEELSRKLSYLEFVMHAPSNYYYDRTTPYPLPDYLEQDIKPGGYIWTSLPKYQRNNSII